MGRSLVPYRSHSGSSAGGGTRGRPAGGRGPPATDRPIVMVNRDLHYDHVLRGTREPWLAVDPMAMVGSIEYQTGQLFWTRYDEVAATGRLR